MEEKKPWRYCVVGNIVRERIDENGILRYGNVAFKGDARIYIEGKNYYYDYVRNGIYVLGLNRCRRFVYDFVPKDLLENVRFSRTYKPIIMDMMHEYEGHDGWWGDSDEDGLDAKMFANNWPEFQKMRRTFFVRNLLKQRTECMLPGFMKTCGKKWITKMVLLIMRQKDTG